MRQSRVTAEQATGFLRERFGDTVGAVARLGHGEWSTAYAFQVDEAGYVVRFGVHRDDFERDALAARFGSRALPVPRVIEIGEAFGGCYAISERVFGGFVDDLDEPGLRGVLPSLFAMFDAQRRVDLAHTRGYGVWGADGNAPFAAWRDALLDVAVDRPGGRTHPWRAPLEQSPTGAGPFDAAYAELERLVHDLPDERHLIHGDLLNYNLLVRDDRIAAAIDWGCSMYGDWLYDLAWFAYWQDPWYPQWQRIDFVAEAKAYFAAIGLDVPGMDERLRCYMFHIGLADQVYSAFTGRFAQVATAAERLRGLLERR